MSTNTNDNQIICRNKLYDKKYLDKEYLYEELIVKKRTVRDISTTLDVSWDVVKSWAVRLGVIEAKPKKIINTANHVSKNPAKREQWIAKLRATKLGKKNPQYTGVDQKLVNYIGKVVLGFNYAFALKNNKKCINGCSSSNIEVHHIIRQVTILQTLQELFPEEFKNREWVIEKVFYIHKDLGDSFLMCLCESCHGKIRKGYEDLRLEQELFKKLDFKKQVKKIVENSRTQLGKKTLYIDTYSPDLIFPVNRENSRERIGNIQYKMKGLDIWNCYEFSGLDNTGKPFNHILKLGYDCYSESIVESKSLKLYLNSFNQTKINNIDEVLNTVQKDLMQRLKINTCSVVVDDVSPMYSSISSRCLDQVLCDEYEYEYNPQILKAIVKENIDQDIEYKFHTNHLKSNCRHSGLPDWGTVLIKYTPNKQLLDTQSLYKYIVSFRNHKEFHEECVERIMYDIIKYLDPKYLFVAAQYTRRGGIDINPIRIYDPFAIKPHETFNYLFSTFKRLPRQ